jgi:hypothetical protein
MQRVVALRDARRPRVGVAERRRARVAELQHVTDRLEGLRDLGEHLGIDLEVQALRIDRDRAGEEEQPDRGAHQDARHEHEGIEELGIRLTQRRGPPETPRDYSSRGPPCSEHVPNSDRGADGASRV